MTVNSRRTLVIGIIVGALLILSMGRMPFSTGFGSLPTEIAVQLLSLWRIAIVVAAIWFGSEVLASLRRLEERIADTADERPEFVHGS
jgi:hypothetical protein